MVWLDSLALALSSLYGLVWCSVLLPALWFALWTTKDHRRRRAYAAHIKDWPDAALPAVRDHYVQIVRTYRRASFPKPSWRDANAALVMATVVQERLDLANGRAPSTYLRSRRRIIHEARK